MKRSLQFSLVALIGSSLMLTGCWNKVDLGQHASDTGLMPESFIPAEVGLFTSYSLRDDDQYAAIQVLEEELGEEGRFSELFAAQLDDQYATDGITYGDDILPALGERFRVVFGSRPATEDVDAFTVVTLADPDKMEDVLDVLVTQDLLETKKLSSNNAYVNEENDFYASIHEDLLLVANRPEGIVEMLDLKEDESLWNNDKFQDIMENVGSNYVFFGGLFPELMGEELDLPAGFGVSDIPDVIIQQSIVVRAEETGLSFDAYMLADKDAAKDADIAFDKVPKEKPYLIEEVPAEGLMAYLESYGLQQTFTQADALGDSSEALDQLNLLLENYFAMDFEEEILSFMDKGFVLAMHKNGAGVVPGVTLLFDVSSDTENAEALISKLDGQISGLQLIFEQSLPGALTRSSLRVMGETVQVIRMDLSAIPKGEANAPLPASVTSSEIQLMYGVVNDRMLISTASIWEEDDVEMLADSDLYLSLKDQLDGVDQGLALLDPQGISDFLDNLIALREQLGLANSTEMAGLEELLTGFKGFIAASSTKAYESHFSGYLMID